MRRLLCTGLIILLGCGSSTDDESSSGSSATVTTGNTSSSTTSGQGGASSTSSTTSSGTGGDGSEGSGGSGGAPGVVRFIAMGDGGEGNATQAQVAQIVENECAARGGCMFALYLGDNIYNSGVDSAMDAQFQSKFEVPYAALSFPFYITLGNHDYGGGGIGYEFFKGAYQVDYTMYSSKWVLPDHYYKQSVSAGSTTVDLFSLDTNSVMYTGASTQLSWIQSELAASTATWKLVFGHHTYVSNGQHGNAGAYEGIPGIPIVSGGNVKNFIESGVCGAADVYFCGHDHNRQWLQPTCGTEFVVSGTAAKYTGLQNRGTATFFENDQLAGFFLGEISGNTMTGWFYDEQGTLEYTRTVTK